MIVFIYKSFRRIYRSCKGIIDKFCCLIIFHGNGVSYNSFRTVGIPYLVVARNGVLKLGTAFAMNNGIEGNPIGCYSKCTFFVDKGAKLIIGNNVGMSQSALICYQSIIIGNNVKLGGGVKVYDADFHSLDSKVRASLDDTKNKKKAAVLIEDNAFIGAYSIILKGVTVGENSIVGAGSVVTKSIPANQIWGGNPAKFIRNI